MFKKLNFIGIHWKHFEIKKDEGKLDKILGSPG